METLFKSFALLESASSSSRDFKPSSSLYFDFDFNREKPSPSPSSSLYFDFDFNGEKPSSSKVVTKKPISSVKSKKWHLIHPPFISEFSI